MSEPIDECCREGGDHPCGPFLDQEREIERLRDALKWSLTLADIALEQCRYDRMKAGHEMTFEKNGVKWVGLYQSEWDQREAAYAALSHQ